MRSRSDTVRRMAAVGGRHRATLPRGVLREVLRMNAAIHALPFLREGRPSSAGEGALGKTLQIANCKMQNANCGLQFFTLLCVIVATVPLRAQITLNAEFDHGSLDQANSLVAGNLVTLAGRDNFNEGAWKWLYFSASGVVGQTVTWQIDDNFATGGSDLNDHEMVYSYDGQTWHFFDNNQRNSSQRTYTFSNNAPFTENEVFVAYGLPYSFGRTVAHAGQVASSPWVEPTSSANGALVIGQSPGGVDDLGRAIVPRDMYGYKITDPAGGAQKAKIAVIGGVHANETLGNYMLEGFVEFLLGDDFEAARLRRLAEIYVYPMVNPDGRFAGYNRSTVEHPATDPNRVWDSPLYGTLSDVKLVGDALLADTGGDVDYFIDFHSTVADKLGHYGFVLPSMQNDPFWTTFLSLEPEVDTRDASLVSLTAARFGRAELNAEFTTTFETEFLAGENVDRFLGLGESIGQAFELSFRVPADINFDGVLDEQDWLRFIDGAETDLAGLTAIEAFAAGDLDGDGVNGIADFGIFKQAYVNAHGPTGFQALFAVPEPGSGAMLLMTLAGFGFRATVGCAGAALVTPYA